MKIVKAGILAVGLAGLLCSVGCNSHDPGDSEAPDKSDIFVGSDGATGSISLAVRDTDLPVGETTHFGVSVKRADGTAVQGIRVSCDTESGLAILEPTTGSELTDVWGGISGVVGCAKPGSLQIGCRLPVGVNKRELKTIHCTGETPADFTGWPGSSGGGLRGGVVDPIDTTDNVRIIKVGFFDSSSSSLSYSIDTEQGVCGTAAPFTPEPWYDTYVQFLIVNKTQALIRLTEYSFDVGSTGSNGWLAFSGAIDLPPDSTDGVKVDAGFAKAISGMKQFYNTGENIDFTGFRNIKFAIAAENLTTGESFTLEATTGASFGNFDMCAN